MKGGPLWAGLVAAAAGLLALPVTPRQARAQDAAACDAWDVEYLLAANVRLSDTRMGAGDGVYPIGPGKLVLRVDARSGATRMIDYQMKDTFTVVAKTLFWGTRVTNDTWTKVTPNSCGVAAEGVLRERTLRW